VERCALRSGNVHSADGWRAVLEPVVARYLGTVKRLRFRGDAAFDSPEIYEFLEAEGIGYSIRLPGAAPGGGAVVADQSQGEADQDRREGRQSWSRFSAVVQSI
jgi:hypothetical protein